jgi:hypothetical protein
VGRVDSGVGLFPTHWRHLMPPLPGLHSRLIAGFLYRVKSTDPMTYSIVALILRAVTLVACYVPAHRATKVHPLVSPAA